MSRNCPRYANVNVMFLPTESGKLSKEEEKEAKAAPATGGFRGESERTQDGDGDGGGSSSRSDSDSSSVSQEKEEKEESTTTAAARTEWSGSYQWWRGGAGCCIRGDPKNKEKEEACRMCITGRN